MIQGTPQRTAAGGFQVYVGQMPLDPGPSQKLYNHSPDGFAWGYAGSGPAQLALALLLYFTDKDFALQQYQQFKFDVIAALPKNRFTMAEVDVKKWAKKKGWKP